MDFGYITFGPFRLANHIATCFNTGDTLIPHTDSTIHIAYIMFFRPIPAMLGTFLLSFPVFAADAMGWSSLSIYQVTPLALSCLCLSNTDHSLSQTGLLYLITRRCLATLVNANIAVAHGRG
jgi:hypothetical protein